MNLEMFDFIENVVTKLDDIKNELLLNCRFLEFYFQELLSNSTDQGFLNINSRVKSENSLREKIIRNNYYKTYSSANELIENITDLIGIRIECRFSNDEEVLYKLLKKFFNKKHKDGTYYNIFDKDVRLKINLKQPEIQKNGFKIYRIDGIYNNGTKNVNFELQIKSLVNIFWSEIEHKVIYKNYNYIIGEEFFSNMLKSVKDNLQLIDNQLLSMYNHFNKLDSVEPINRRLHGEALLSKLVYDVFAVKVKADLGFVIDFRKACDLVIEYLSYLSKKEKLYNYDNLMLKVITKLNEYNVLSISFSEKILLDRKLKVFDEYENYICNAIEEVINSDLQWNLFFKILIAIEGDGIAYNIESFAKFILYKLCKISSLVYVNASENSNKIRDDIHILLIDYFLQNKSLEILYENKINELASYIENFIFTLENKSANEFDNYWSNKKLELNNLFAAI